MDDATKDRLEAILSAHESEIASEQDRIDQAYMAEVLFAQQFAALKKMVILPAFADLESALKRHGHVCKTVEIDELHRSDGAGGGVRCEFYPKGWNCGAAASLAEPPALTVSCDNNAKTVKLSESTFGPLDGGWSGDLGVFSLEDITADRIAEAFVGLVEKILLDKSFIAKSIKDLRPSRGRRSRSLRQIDRDRRAA